MFVYGTHTEKLQIESQMLILPRKKPPNFNCENSINIDDKKGSKSQKPTVNGKK